MITLTHEIYVDDKLREASPFIVHVFYGMTREQFYRPRDRGFEREISKRLEYWAKLRAERKDVAGGN